jgi:hypothetical protein
MRRTRGALQLVTVLALVVACVLLFRAPDADPVPDGSPAADSAAAAPPPPLATPGPRRAPAATNTDTTIKPVTLAPPGSTTATLEGAIVRAENRHPIPFAKVSLSFRESGDRPGTTAAIEADRDGRFSTSIEVGQSMPLWDGWCPGGKFCFRRFATDGASDDPPRVEAKPGQTVRFTIELAELTTISGLVVDEGGRPLAGARIGHFMPRANRNPMGSMYQFETGESGRFEFGSFSHPEDVLDADAANSASNVHVSFERRPPLSFDLRKLTEGERAEWRIVVPQGRTIQGRLIDETGRPIGAVTVSASYADPQALRVANTDENGRFTLENVGDGEATFGAYAPGSDLEAARTMTVAADVSDLVLVARPLDLSSTPGAVNVMGLRLADVSEEMRKTRDPNDGARVAIVDPGVVGGFFGMGRIEAGTGIWMIGDSKVVDIKHLIDLLLAEYERSKTQAHLMIRIVTTHGRGKDAFTNTQHFGVDPLEIERLKRVRATMR